MNKNIIIVGTLVLLVVIASVQAVQLFNIKSDLKDIGGSTPIKKTSSSSTTSGSTSNSVPTNLQNLPGMVGGC